MTTNQKPARVHCQAHYEEAGKPIYFFHEKLTEAIKPLERKDWIVIEGHAVPVSLVRDILNTWDKPSKKPPYHGRSSLHVTSIQTETGREARPVIIFSEYPDEHPNTCQTVYIQPAPEDFMLERLQAVVCVLDFLEHQPEQPRPDKWLSLACAHGVEAGRRPALSKIYGNLATDGYRLHRDLTQPDPASCPFDWRKVYPHPSDNVALVPAGLLLKAVKGAKSMNKETIRLYFNGRLDVMATSEALGTNITAIEEGYQHTGPDMMIGLNPKFLIEALTGMTGEVCISLVSPSAPILISDGKREAVLMPRLLK